VRQSKLNEVPSLALGTSPVTLKEMVTSFSTIANGGNYIEPYVVTAVEDREHHVLDTFGGKSSEQALSNRAAQTLLDVMRGTIDYGTAAGLRPRFGLTGDLAGKTGTTQDNTDGWFILMHPQLVAGAWVGFNDNRVTMRSSYWGQGAHNALFVVGDMMQQAEKAGVVDGKAAFAAPHLLDEEKPLVDRMGDWWNSVFNSSTSGDPTVATVPQAPLPEAKVDAPQLQPPPSAVDTTAQAPVAPALPPPSAPVIAPEPQRVPSFPRPLETARPVETVPGTQVYRTPEATARVSDPAGPQSSQRASPPVSSAPSGNGGSTASAIAAAPRDGASAAGTRSSGSTVTLSRDGATTLTFPRDGAATAAPATATRRESSSGSAMGASGASTSSSGSDGGSYGGSASSSSGPGTASGGVTDASGSPTAGSTQ
jgi:penicillin-binding protein 1A